VDDGQKLRVKGEGDAGLKGGEAGDLYIFISVEKDPVFRRDGVDLYSNIRVSFIDALLGTKIKVCQQAHSSPTCGDGKAPSARLGSVYSRARSLCVTRGQVSCPVDGPLSSRLLCCAALQVPVIDGDAEISIKEGTQPASVLRLRNRGVPKLMSGDASQRGDHYFTVRRRTRDSRTILQHLHFVRPT
jgi:DnaJ-class molecular chaperone